MNICFFFYDSYLIRKSWAVLFQIYPLLSNFTVLTTANICLVVSWFHDPATREIILKYRFRWSHTSLSLPPIYFWDSGFHSPGWPWTPPPSPSASIYQVRGTQECATMLNLDHITLLSKAFLLLSISIYYMSCISPWHFHICVHLFQSCSHTLKFPRFLLTWASHWSPFTLLPVFDDTVISVGLFTGGHQQELFLGVWAHYWELLKVNPSPFSSQQPLTAHKYSRRGGALQLPLSSMTHP